MLTNLVRTLVLWLDESRLIREYASIVVIPRVQAESWWWPPRKGISRCGSHYSNLVVRGTAFQGFDVSDVIERKIRGGVALLIQENIMPTLGGHTEGFIH